MKRIILLVAVFCICFGGFPLFAQHAVSAKSYKPFHHEFSLGIGKISAISFTEGAGLSDVDPNIDQDAYILYSTYRLCINRKVSFGATFAFENNFGTWTGSTDTYGGPKGKGTFKRNIYTLGLEAHLYYSSNDKSTVRAYGYLGMGVSYINEVREYDADFFAENYVNGVNKLGKRGMSADRFQMNYQFCPLGITFGKRLRGYAEFGFGYKGMYSWGLLYRI
jgi:hypothetical protein